MEDKIFHVKYLRASFESFESHATWKGRFTKTECAYHQTMMLSNTALRTATRRIISSNASRRSASSTSAKQAFSKQGEEARKAALPLLAVAALGGCVVTVGRNDQVCSLSRYFLSLSVGFHCFLVVDGSLKYCRGCASTLSNSWP